MFVANAFADAPLLMYNQSIENGCTVSNVGVSSGTAAMVPHFAQLTQNASIPNACVYVNVGAYSGTVNATPMFSIASYTCGAGQWLPADAIECQTCPDNASCTAGTYTYNATTNQGITISGDSVLTNGGCSVSTLNKSSGTVNAVPQFQPASYTCATGYYLPADAIACAECLPGATCAGGTYTYNATSDQGISCSGAIHYGRCHARCPKMSGELRIGQYTHPLWAGRADVPSPVIHIQFLDDNSMCYMYLTPDDVPVDEHHGFHIMYNGSPYHAINFGLYGLE